MRRVAVAVALLLAAGCSTPAPPPPPPPASAAPTTAAGPALATDAQLCAGVQDASRTIAAIVKAVQDGPVLPAAIALFLLGARDQASRSAVDPALATAQAELVAAIDELDAQGKAALPPGANPAETAVRLDGTRVAAAVADVEQACAALK